MSGPWRRWTVLGLLLTAATGLVALLGQHRLSTPLKTSLALPFQMLGTPVKLMDRLVSRLLPVDAVDERLLGDAYRESYGQLISPNDPDQVYLDRLMTSLRSHTRRPFPYRAYVLSGYGGPNAMALPGGVVLVTRELLGVMASEAELVAVLAHELGHIELGHCFDLVRFELLARHRSSEPDSTLGEIADQAVQLLIRHGYSKTTEHEADDYAYSLLVSSPYDPAALGSGMQSMARAVEAANGPERQQADPLMDYWLSHPPLPIRISEFEQKGAAWWRRHPGERRYRGYRNLQKRQSFQDLSPPGEWRQG